MRYALNFGCWIFVIALHFEVGGFFSGRLDTSFLEQGCLACAVLVVGGGWFGMETVRALVDAYWL